MSNPREKFFEGVILKKQPLSEADELLTIYTQELGKVRAVAKSSKLLKSKLQHQLQPMFLCKFTLAGRGGLLKIIQVQTEQVFRNIQGSQDLVQLWYVAAELIMRATPDEQSNLNLYEVLREFLFILNTAPLDQADALLVLIKFKIEALNALGLGIQTSEADSAGPYFFSNEAGGFVSGSKPAGGVAIVDSIYQSFLNLSHAHISDLPELTNDPQQLNSLISQYINYQLEREIRAEKFIQSAPG